MGVMTILATTTVATVHFPMWGSMLFPPSNSDSTEEDYYIQEWYPDEVAAVSDLVHLLFF